MAEDAYSFDQARVRLEEIAAQVRKKDVSLEKSLDLLEEGVRLANLCTEQIDQTQWKAVLAEAAEQAAEPAGGEPEGEREAEVTAGDGEGAAEPDEEAGAGSLEADGDVASEDPRAASEEAPSAEDPDVEA